MRNNTVLLLWLFLASNSVGRAALALSPAVFSLNSLIRYFSFSAAVFCFSSAWTSCAISESPPSLQVPPVIRVESGSDAPLPVLTGSDAGSQKAMIVIRGLPWTIGLTTGRLFPSGVWALKASETRSARFITAPTTRHVAQLTISLVTLEGDYLSNAAARLEVEPGRAAPVKAEMQRWAALPQSTAALPGAVPEAPPVQTKAPPENLRRQVLSAAEMDRIIKLMDRGDQHLTEGKIASARRFYQLAAEMGWSDGALAIARTYDAGFLKRFPIIGGIEPNAALAQHWYEEAREIGLKFLPPPPSGVAQQGG